LPADKGYVIFAAKSDLFGLESFEVFNSKAPYGCLIDNYISSI